ncbi:MAG: hydrogenase large subunit [Saccharofermentanales bacterium]
MAIRSVIPFGPQHPVLPEPIHLDLVVEDEKVIEAIPSIGFIHRGLEKLVEKKDFLDFVYIAERTCGICSFMHGMGYCESIERGMNIEIPDRARYLRTIWSEMSRMHSHLMWLGLLADGFGFESLFMEAWRIREKVLDMFEHSTGGRVIFSVNKVGGQRKDMDDGMLNDFLKIFKSIESDAKQLSKTFLNDYSVNTRLNGVGILTKEQAHELGTVGPFMRASGINLDTRKIGYAAYADLDFEPIISTQGDCYARTYVRINEIFQSIDIIRQAISKIPQGEVSVPVKGVPQSDYFMRVEQPRGEAVYYTVGNGTKFLDRMRIRTPTFANLPGLIETLKGCQLADVPILILTIDPCISCVER